MLIQNDKRVDTKPAISIVSNKFEVNERNNRSDNIELKIPGS